MFKAILFIIGCVIGIFTAYYFYHPQEFNKLREETSHIVTTDSQNHMVMGFLPYWLLDKADKDYNPYINTLTYFALTIEGDGTIQKYTNPGESEPGWYALEKGKAGERLKQARQDGLILSLALFSGNEEAIEELISEPEAHAQTLMEEIEPLMKQHGFTDVNIDVESVQLTTEESQLKFTRFVKEIRDQIDSKNLGTLSIDASPSVFIRPYLVDPKSIAPLVDTFIIMGYDYHYQGSSVTGPVAPLAGAESISEFDTLTGVKLAVKMMPSEKVVLAIPLYGYEWETLDPFNRAATIPGSGITASNRRVEEQIKECENCQILREIEGDEAYAVYKNRETGVYHQIFYPDEEATQNKIKLAETYKLGGMALWALGYEGDRILTPFKSYK